METTTTRGLQSTHNPPVSNQNMCGWVDLSLSLSIAAICSRCHSLPLQFHSHCCCTVDHHPLSHHCCCCHPHPHPALSRYPLPLFFWTSVAVLNTADDPGVLNDLLAIYCLPADAFEGKTTFLEKLAVLGTSSEFADSAEVCPRNPLSTVCSGNEY